MKDGRGEPEKRPLPRQRESFSIRRTTDESTQKKTKRRNLFLLPAKSQPACPGNTQTMRKVIQAA